MSTVEERNAIITHVSLTTADHGLLSAWLTLDYGGSGQGFGGYNLYSPRSGTMEGAPDDFCGWYLWNVLKTVGVDSWEQLVGKTIRVRASRGGVEAIGHIVKDRWFYPARWGQEETAHAGR